MNQLIVASLTWWNLKDLCHSFLHHLVEIQIRTFIHILFFIMERQNKELDGNVWKLLHSALVVWTPLVRFYLPLQLIDPPASLSSDSDRWYAHFFLLSKKALGFWIKSLKPRQATGSKVDLTTGDTFWNFSSCRRMMSRNIILVVYVTNTSDSMQWSEIIILNICTVSKYVIKSPWIWLWKGGSCLFFSRSKCFIVLKLPPSSWWLTSQGKMFWNGCSKKKSQKWRRISAIKPSEGAFLISSGSTHRVHNSS